MAPRLLFPLLLFLVFHLAAHSSPALASSFLDNFTVSWGEPNNVRLLDNDQVLQLILDNKSAAGFASKDRYMFGSIDMQMMLVPGNSSGTVTAYYFSSETTNHDELDFEFLGNLSGQPYILQTNVFANGTGGREQRIYLWFDPTTEFHTYSVIWNPQHITFNVDGIPIREFPNNEAAGQAYLSKQPMRIYSSIWNGDSWATEGGYIKIDWSQAPFNASYTNYVLDACLEGSDPSCATGKWWDQQNYHTLDSQQQGQLAWVQQNYMIYNYCTDEKRYPVAPMECKKQPQ